jgi:hypothetical protein
MPVPASRRSTAGSGRCSRSTRTSLTLLDDNDIAGEIVVREVRQGRVPIEPFWGRPYTVRDEFRQINAQ